MQKLNPVRIAVTGMVSAALIAGAVAATPAFAGRTSGVDDSALEQGVRAQATTEDITLAFRWSLVPWPGADDVPVGEAIRGTGAAEGGNDISGDVLSIFEWDGASQTWKGYFVSGEGVPGANDLETLQNNTPYWIAIEGPGEVTWTVAIPGDE